MNEELNRTRLREAFILLTESLVGERLSKVPLEDLDELNEVMTPFGIPPIEYEDEERNYLLNPYKVGSAVIDLAERLIRCDLNDATPVQQDKVDAILEYLGLTKKDE
jgi:hypothetical protein